jgi:hypothetical protein
MQFSKIKKIKIGTYPKDIHIPSFYIIFRNKFFPPEKTFRSINPGNIHMFVCAKKNHIN